MQGPVGGGDRYFSMRKRQGVDYRFVQGSDNWWEVEFTDSDTLDWTNFAARGEMRDDFRDFASDVRARIDVLITQANPGLNKRLFCSVDNAQSDLVTTDEGRYDIEIDNGQVIRRVISEVVWENSRQVTNV